jgi:hypothetical protein
MFAVAGEKKCAMENSQEALVLKLFSGKAHVFSLLWWNDPKSNVINARSFIINGHDSIPVFSSEAEGKAQVAGSGHEKDLVGIEPALLAGILQRMDYAVLNPGGSNPIQFKTCILAPYAKGGGA